MDKVVPLPGTSPQPGESSLQEPDLPHASVIRCTGCGGNARLVARRADAFNDDFEMWTYECPDCGYQGTTRVDR